MRKLASAVLIFVLVAVIVVAQRGSRGGYGGRGFRRGYYEDYRTPREITQHGHETPPRTNGAGFEKDVFTFVRVKRARPLQLRRGPWGPQPRHRPATLFFPFRNYLPRGRHPRGF